MDLVEKLREYGKVCKKFNDESLSNRAGEGYSFSNLPDLVAPSFAGFIRWLADDEPKTINKKI